MKFKKIALFIGLFVVMAATLSSCTKSFCTVNDKAQTLYALEEYKEGKTYAEGTKTQLIVKDAESKGMLTPSPEFNAFIEVKIDEHQFLSHDFHFPWKLPKIHLPFHATSMLMKLFLQDYI